MDSNNNNLVNKLAASVPATSLEASKEKSLDTNYFIQCVEAALNSELKKYFDMGYNYFKVSGNDSVSFLKNFFYLFSDYLKSIIRESNLDVERQEVIIENLALLSKNIETNFLIFENFITALKIDKKTFDSNKLFMIITGYAINNLKKNYKN